MQNITKLIEQTIVYKENVICSFPPNPQRPKPCHTVGKSTQMDTKHNTDLTILPGITFAILLAFVHVFGF